MLGFEEGLRAGGAGQALSLPSVPRVAWSWGRGGQS